MMTLCIVQARMDSTRFPGKVLEPLADRPVLDHVVGRCNAAGLPTVVATSNRSVDDPIAVWAAAQRYPIALFRWGDDDREAANVLERYRRCMDAYAADAVVRVTGDCPFVPVAFIEVTAEKLEEGYEVASLACGFGQVPDGWDVEGCAGSWIRRLDADAPTLAEREHVFPGIYRRLAARERAQTLPASYQDLPERADAWMPDWFVKQKFSVDTRTDLNWLRFLSQHLDCSTPRKPTGEDLVQLLTAHPEYRR